MPRFVPDMTARLNPSENAAHEQDTKLRSEGDLIERARTPVQLRNPDASGVETRDGASCHQICRSPDRDRSC